MAIKPDQLKDEILKQFKDFDYNVQWDMSEASRKRTREGARMLRKSHATDDTGKYNKGWKTRKTSRGNMIYNTSRPGLTHLLEKGHEKINEKGWVEGTPHISLVEQQVISNFEKDVERIIRKHSGSS